MNFITLLLLTLLNKGNLTVSSPAFKSNDYIPDKYSCHGENTSPELNIVGIPKDAKCLALIVDDPDAPHGTFDHWVLWNIPVAQTIAANSQPGVAGKNGAGQNAYTGPCPPGGTHHYHFKVYALDTMLDVKAGADKKTVEDAMKGHILAEGELVGLFKSKKS
ncbi:MAG: YbhB/YbcL family Raf kinase inhibitor-like protein [Chitinophagales bacterium]